MSSSSPATVPARRGVADLGTVGRAVQKVLSPLQHGYLSINDEPWAVARLAQLRRGAGKAPEEVPELLGLTGIEELYTSKGWLQSSEHGPAAAYLAVTLYAQHQQSHRTEWMHIRGRPLGWAVREVMHETRPGEIDQPLRLRFVRIANASSAGELAYRLRQLILLLRGAGKPIDYGHLADQIERVLDPKLRPKVRQEWGREFHSWGPPKKDEKNQSADDNDRGSTVGTQDHT